LSGARLIVKPAAARDITSTVEWYARQGQELGLAFLGELRVTYDRVVEHPLLYQDLGHGVRRALLRRFPYAVYYVADVDGIRILAVLHASRNPAEWRRRSR